MASMARRAPLGRGARVGSTQIANTSSPRDSDPRPMFTGIGECERCAMTARSYAHDVVLGWRRDPLVGMAYWVPPHRGPLGADHVPHLILTLLRSFAAKNHDHAPPGADDPERALARRFANGEIDEEEFRRRLDVLRSHGLGKS